MSTSRCSRSEMRGRQVLGLAGYERGVAMDDIEAMIARVRQERLTNPQHVILLLLIERPDLLGDEELARAPGRQKHWARWNEIVHEWTRD